MPITPQAEAFNVHQDWWDRVNPTFEVDPETGAATPLSDRELRLTRAACASSFQAGIAWAKDAILSGLES